MMDQPAETLSLRQLRLARGGDTDVVPVPRARVAPPAHNAYLVQIGPPGPGLGRRFTLGISNITLGRDGQCSVPLPDGSVSRMHLVIEPRADGSYFLSDMNSRNGSYVNGAKVSSTSLKDGDYLQLGDCVFRFLAGGNIEAGYHDEIHRLTLLDSLTGVHNRRSLGEFLELELERASKGSRPIAVLLLDVDHFKRVNDEFGHGAGDTVLRGLAERFRENARSEDLVARYGGEEFALALPDTDLHQASIVGERCRRAVAQQPFRVDRDVIAVTVSVGAAAIEAGRNRTIDELLQEADVRMYEGKRAGRNRVVPAPPDSPEDPVNTPPPGATREFQL